MDGLLWAVSLTTLAGLCALGALYAYRTGSQPSRNPRHRRVSTTSPPPEEALLGRVEACERRMDDLHDYVRRTFARLTQRDRRAEEVSTEESTGNPQGLHKTDLYRIARGRFGGKGA